MNNQSPAAAEVAAVAEANDRFYRALEAADLAAMESLWLQADWVRCVHPGWEMLAGWPQVRESWARIFQNSRGLRVMPGDVAIRVTDDFAWVSCTEHLMIFYENSAAPVSVMTTATNLFQRSGGEWLMVLHHASPVPAVIPVSESETVQ
ncbi:MAG: nuclear transport factor 2 family protein [Blastocatellia bacterium]